MKAIQAEVGRDPAAAQIKDGAAPEDWPQVCRRYDDDVERICDIDQVKGYTGLYRCCDDKNQAVYYLVNEDKSLYRLKRKHFLGNIGYAD